MEKKKKKKKMGGGGQNNGDGGEIKTINVKWLVFTNATVISASRLRSVFASCSFSLPRRVQNSLAAGEKDGKKNPPFSVNLLEKRHAKRSRIISN